MIKKIYNFISLLLMKVKSGRGAQWITLNAAMHRVLDAICTWQFHAQTWFLIESAHEIASKGILFGKILYICMQNAASW